MHYRSLVIGGIFGSSLLAFAATSRAQVLDNLVKNSPFGSAGSAGAQVKPEGTLEFRGMFVDNGETFFSVYDAASRTAMWVGLKEAGNPFVVQSYDEAKGTVSVEYQGQVHTVALKQAKVVVLAATPVPAATVAAAGGPPPAVNASPDEAARLAQIAEEIRRRRAIRAQAGQVPRVQPQTAPVNSPAPPAPNRP